MFPYRCHISEAHKLRFKSSSTNWHASWGITRFKYDLGRHISHHHAHNLTSDAYRTRQNYIFNLLRSPTYLLLPRSSSPYSFETVFLLHITTLGHHSSPFVILEAATTHSITLFISFNSFTLFLPFPSLNTCILNKTNV